MRHKDVIPCNTCLKFVRIGDLEQHLKTHSTKPYLSMQQPQRHPTTTSNFQLSSTKLTPSGSAHSRFPQDGAPQQAGSYRPFQTLPIDEMTGSQTYVPPKFLPTPNSPFIYNPILSAPPIMSTALQSNSQSANKSPTSSKSSDSGLEDIGSVREKSKEDSDVQNPVQRKRGRPRKNPYEPRKKRGAIEYDPMGDSCTRILLEYKRNLELRALG